MGKFVGAFLTVVVVAGLVFGVISAVGYYSHNLPDMTAQAAGVAPGGLKQASIALSTFPMNPYEDPEWIDAHKGDYGSLLPPPGDNQDWVTYWPTTNLVVPTHALVTVTITNYDGQTPLLNPFYARAQGIVPGSATVDGKPFTSLDPETPSHTFTIHSLVNANQPWLFVSVPILGAPDDAPADDAGMPLKPIVTQFSFITPDQPGDYIWQCFDPCGNGYNGFGGPMSTKGYMSGTLTVTA
jgi:hypothetical protein